MPQHPLIVVMGVSGSGKTTVGTLLAAALGVPFEDADSLHPPANVAKMAAGHALTDADRAPWLALCGAALARAEPTGMVMACSALKRAYRAQLLEAAASIRFLYLAVPPKLLASRLERRKGHYMPASLLESQLATLEPLASDEPGVTLQLVAGETPDDVVRRALGELSAN